TADGHPEHGPGDATLGVADLGVLGEVAGEAHAGLGHGASLLNAWPGGLPCPWTRGTVATVACREATRGKRWSQRSRPDWINRPPGPAQVPSWLAALAAGGRACQPRPARSLHPGRGGR